MALIKCYECNKEISDTIANCIHCGVALNTADFSFKMDDFKKNNDELIKKKSKKTIFSNYIVVFLMCIIMSFIIKVVEYDWYLERLTFSRFLDDCLESLWILFFSVPIAAILSKVRKKEFSWQLLIVTLIFLILIILKLIL